MSALAMDLHISRPVKMLIVVFILALLVLGVYLPMSRQQVELKSAIETSKSRYLDAVVLVEQYRALSRSTNNKKSVLLQEPLFSYVEKTTRALKLTQRIDYVRPENRTQDDGSVTEVVHVAFKGITLPEFVNFLYQIEVKKREIFIQSIFIKKDGKKNLNTQMTLQKRT